MSSHRHFRFISTLWTWKSVWRKGELNLSLVQLRPIWDEVLVSCWYMKTNDVSECWLCSSLWGLCTCMIFFIFGVGCTSIERYECASRACAPVHAQSLEQHIKAPHKQPRPVLFVWWSLSDRPCCSTAERLTLFTATDSMHLSQPCKLAC